MARSLSQTCRRLRALLVDLVWESVSIATVDKLGHLRELIKGSPLLGRSIKIFAFSWDMCGDADMCAAYDESEGTLLDLAFRNRVELWESLRKQYGCDVDWDPPEEGYPIAYFVHKGKSYYAPGKPTRLIDESGVRRHFDSRAPRDHGIGPDGDGEDDNIKNAEQFVQCVTEIIAQMPCLEVFEWTTPVASIPEGVFNILAQSNKLKSLRVHFALHRGNSHEREYVETARVDVPELTPRSHCSAVLGTLAEVRGSHTGSVGHLQYRQGGSRGASRECN